MHNRFTDASKGIEPNKRAIAFLRDALSPDCMLNFEQVNIRNKQGMRMRTYEINALYLDSQPPTLQASEAIAQAIDGSQLDGKRVVAQVLPNNQLEASIDGFQIARLVGILVCHDENTFNCMITSTFMGYL